MTGLWKTWITLWCWATVALGVVLALGASPATDWGARFYYDMVYWPLDGASAFDESVRFTCGVLGAVMIGWAISIFGLVAAAERVGAPAWRMLTTAMVVWFTIDSAISIASGVPGNAVANAAFLATYLIPVLASGVLSAPQPAQARA